MDALLPAKEELLSEKDPSPDSIVVEACVAARAASMGSKRGGEPRMDAESGSTSRIAVGDVAVMVAGGRWSFAFPMLLDRSFNRREICRPGLQSNAVKLSDLIYLPN